MATDAVTLIEQDHREMEAVFDKVLAGDGDRDALIAEITTRLTAHARAEEQEVYPALEDAAPQEQDEVEHAHREHHEAEHLLRKARNLTVSPHFEEAFTAFVDAVKHHVEEEESEVLPALRKAVDAATLRNLGTAFERARLQLLGANGEEEPALQDATRNELYDLAKEADIPGRSTMNKQELTEAILEQQRADTPGA
jgi:hemerythrin superfamily protein